MSAPKVATVGIALDGTRLSVAWRDTGVRTARWEAASAPCDGSPGDINRALAELVPRAPATSIVSVTLVSPLAHTRALSLPRMPREAIQTVLARDWFRHVIGHRQTPHTVSVQAADRGRWLATFAPTDVVAAIAEVAEANGWRTLDTCSGDDSIAGAARALAPQESRSTDCIMVVCDATGPALIAHLRGGRPWRSRRFVPTASSTDIDDITNFIRASLGTPGTAPVLILGHDARTSAVVKTLAGAGTHARAIDVGLGLDAGLTDLMAVAGTMGAATLPLRSAHAQQTRVRQARATTRWLAVAAGVALIAALGLERWRIQRDLADVQRERGLIAASASKAIAERAAIEGTTEAVLELTEREGNASRVSSVIAAVAVAVPSGTTLTAIRVAGDSVTVEGESDNSAAVYEALRAVSALDQMKLAAPLRQERRGNDEATELFAFSARVRPLAVPARGGAQ